jgi:6-pyruvoyltetrahydropterin/6-carboxytetrahydropterin synthase
MGTAYLTRRVSFAAAHRYRRPEWSDAKNEEVFGLCARPQFHGHSYSCDVTVSGPVDETTGMIIDLRVIDLILMAEVVDRFDHRNLNTDIPEFADGKLIPTSENIARIIAGRVQAVLGNRALVAEVVIHESPTLSGTWRTGG